MSLQVQLPLHPLVTQSLSGPTDTKASSLSNSTTSSLVAQRAGGVSASWRTAPSTYRTTLTAPSAQSLKSAPLPRTVLPISVQLPCSRLLQLHGSLLQRVPMLPRHRVRSPVASTRLLCLLQLPPKGSIQMVISPPSRGTSQSTPPPTRASHVTERTTTLASTAHKDKDRLLTSRLLQLLP